jgi:hypothetical protein
MNDINWHDLNEDESWALICGNPNHLAIIETDITWRIDSVQYIEDRPAGPYLSTACEKAIRFAFIDKKA